MSRGTWDDLPYLDALRPESGWRTEFALMGTYSLDLYALVAALLALAGVDDDRGSGSKIDFANAMDLLTGKVCVLAQRGRLLSPSKAPKVMAILDQFVKEVPLDERQASWHPKIALVKHRTEDNSLSRWSCWLGSRNLSRDLSWDVGLSFNSVDKGKGRSIPGFAALARSLAERAALAKVNPARIFRELEQTAWEVPAGCEIESIDLFEGAGRSMPQEPEGLKELTVISPFIDGGVLGEFGLWGVEGTRRRVVSIPSTYGVLAQQKKQPLAHFQEQLFMRGPLLEDSVSDEGDPLTADLPEEEQTRGLHAKVISTRHRGGNTLWLGSANATRRGWLGPNTEVVARLKVSKEIVDALDGFARERCHEVTQQLLQAYAEVEPPEPLEDARKVVAATWSVVQRVADDTHVLEAQTNPNPPDRQIQLNVRLLGQTFWVLWPRDQLRIALPVVGRGEHTEFIECHLVTGTAQLSWLQLTPMDPPLDEERDSQAIARFLDPRTFLLWIRSLLTVDVLTDGGGEWHQPQTRNTPVTRIQGPLWETPTLEEVLKAWSRDPARFKDIDRKVKQYFGWIDRQTEVVHDADYLPLLKDFREVWKIVERELVGESL